MDRFPTAEERWPRGGEVINMSKVFLIGNAQSRIGFDISGLRKHGKVYGCNAIYRTNPDEIKNHVGLETGLKCQA